MDPLSTDPATGTEYEGLKCIKYKRMSSGVQNTFTGAKATCTNNKACWAVEKRGVKGSYCELDPKTNDWKTTLNGMVNLEPKEESIVWLKGN